MLNFVGRMRKCPAFFYPPTSVNASLPFPVKRLLRFALFLAIVATHQGLLAQPYTGINYPNPKDTTPRIAILLLPEVPVRPLWDQFTSQTVAGYNGDELRSRFPGATLTEALEGTFGLDLRQRGGADVQSDLSVRGSTFDQVLVVVDGVPQYDPQTGHHAFNLPLPLGAVERVELLANGGSYRYGPFAFAGVLYITTRGAQGSYVSAGAGQFGYTQVASGFPFSVNKPHFAATGRLDVETKSADGWKRNTDFDQVHLYGSARTSTWGGPLFLRGGWGRKRFGAQNFYSFNFPEQYEAVNTYTAQLQYGADRNVFRLFARQHYDQFELFREEPGYFLRQSNGLFLNTVDSTFAPSWYQNHNFHRNRTLGGEWTGRPLSWNLNASGNQRLLLETGADFRYDEIKSNALGLPISDTAYFPRYGTALSKGDTRRHGGAFAAAKWSGGGISKQWELQAAGRIHYSDAFGIQFLPGVEASAKSSVEHRWSVAANYATRFPTFTDLYYTLGGAIGSANLQPEYAWNVEAAHRYQTSGMQWQTALFARQGRQLIDWVSNIQGQFIATNLQEATFYGAETYLQWRAPLPMLEMVRLGGSTLFHAGSAPSGTNSTYALDYLRYRGVVQIQTAEYRGFKATLRSQHSLRNGSFRQADGTTGKYTAQHQTDLRLSQTVGPNMTLGVDVLNVWNAALQDRGGIALPGRWIRGSFQLTW